ncbi:ergothioneine biosynthesis protein EgtB [Shewanella eurypsychrophilus]|uniref:Ergothioneine biosynthesis protein EgtB n=1 Tax=Shewanella eurypsychrophilus TaxID=2593656 RepID=A0ABX6V6T6_9GAMM|nr:MULTISPECIES: ergothioneine biosynthesis protein EgtB [Shewanella]QFU23059.1 ergothioneine biosynthesis protein EgtB [Shewanella sp. YLB-09]QPG58342.1 ergothioneine biosynthesis protein EgtB [Shewanella eurypsychrophilus]
MATSDSCDREELILRFSETRKTTADICAHLEIEDLCIQPSAEVSPPKWHLGHTTWFFEELILQQYCNDYNRFDKQFSLLFNSYYKSAGLHWTQKDRGNLSRPTVSKIYQYRQIVDDAIVSLLENGIASEVAAILEIGIQHEQQHQELLYMDIKYILHCNPNPPAYSPLPLESAIEITESWRKLDEQLVNIGHSDNGYAFDNESPQHKAYLASFSISENTVTNGEYLSFIEAGAYQQAKYWLSMGWDWINKNQISSPLYWQNIDGVWYEYTLHGLAPLEKNAPVVHISYFEANAFANWRGCRLPTEQEFEHYLHSTDSTVSSHSDALHPIRASDATNQVWCWTQSHYSAYPGYRPFKGKLEEYNGKFMCNQFVLRGGCVTTPHGHYRHSYRNFYQPHQQWMFSGIRLAKDLS